MFDSKCWQGVKTEPGARLPGSATSPGVLSGVHAALCPPCTKGDPQDIGHMEGAPCASMQVRHGSHPVAALRPKVPATAARPGSRGAVRPLQVAQLDEPSTSTRDADNLADAVDARPLPQRRGAGAAYGTRCAQSTPDRLQQQSVHKISLHPSCTALGAPHYLTVKPSHRGLRMHQPVRSPCHLNALAHSMFCSSTGEGPPLQCTLCALPPRQQPQLQRQWQGLIRTLLPGQGHLQSQ